jgi:hypothetical protein
LVLRPVRLVLESTAPLRGSVAKLPAFQIAEVEQLVMPDREQRNARLK